VSIYDAFVSTLDIGNCLNEEDYPWIIHHTLSFCLYSCISHVYDKFILHHSLKHCSEGYSADTAQMITWMRWYAYAIALLTDKLAQASWGYRISWQDACPYSRYTTYQDLCSALVNIQLSMNPVHSAVTLNFRNLSCSTDSKCHTNYMSCSDLKYLNIHV
jgi:hypothetical protein